MTAARSSTAPIPPPEPRPEEVLVTRSRRPATWAGGFGTVLLVALAVLPWLVQQSYLNTLVNLFVLVILAGMWNVLAGYGGLVSVGQQLFIGLGAYTVLLLAQHGVNPFLAAPLAGVVSAVISVPASWLVFRLSGGYFSIATWVLAIVATIIITGVPSLGGGTGAILPGLSGLSASQLGNDTYWLTLAVVVVSLVAVYALLRSRLGLVLTAVRDNELAARSIGARVARAKRTVYLLSAAGCGLAGSIIAISQLNVQASNVFNVQWTAYMIFAVLIGGIGSIEGPILGSIVFIVLQQTLAHYNAWYLVILGAVAIVCAIWVRGGLWGLLTRWLPVSLFPVRYVLRTDPRETARRGMSRYVLGPVQLNRDRSEARD
jgi:branched-chain amino acid transport system permease protein